MGRSTHRASSDTDPTVCAYIGPGGPSLVVSSLSPLSDDASSPSRRVVHTRVFPSPIIDRLGPLERTVGPRPLDRSTNTPDPTSGGPGTVLGTVPVSSRPTDEVIAGGVGSSRSGVGVRVTVTVVVVQPGHTAFRSARVILLRPVRP